MVCGHLYDMWSVVWYVVCCMVCGLLDIRCCSICGLLNGKWDVVGYVGCSKGCGLLYGI